VKALRDFILDGGVFIGFFSPVTTALQERYVKRRNKHASTGKEPRESRMKPLDPRKNKLDEELKKRKSRNADGENDKQGGVAKKEFRDFLALVGCELRADDGDEGGLPRRKAVATKKYEKMGFKPFQTFTWNHLSFKEPSKWDVIMVCDGKPVLATRRFGKGSVTLCVTSYPVSNEGLAELKNAELISHIVPAGRKTFFDEHFLGIHEVKNIVWLFKKHKLHLLVANIILAAVLFVWSNMSSISNLSAASDNAYRGSATVESDFSNSDGLRNLISRSVRKSELSQVCVSEWLKTVRTRNIPKEDVETVKEILRQNEKSDPVRVYAMISEILNKNRYARRRK
jgi:hypothetical protein